MTRRSSALAGLLAMAAWLASYPFALASPGADAPAEEIAAYFAQHRTELLAATILTTVGATLLLAFFVGLRELFGAAEPGAGALATVGLVAGASTMVLVVVGLAFGQAATFLAQEGGEARRTALLSLQMNLFFAISAWPTILCTLACAGAILRTAVVGRWAAWLAIGVAATHVGAGLSAAPSGLWSPTGPFAQGAPIVFMVWVVSLGVSLLRRPPVRVARPTRLATEQPA